MLEETGKSSSIIKQHNSGELVESTWSYDKAIERMRSLLGSVFC